MTQSLAVVQVGTQVVEGAPEGCSHETLLAYLVRRLLENGANTSFVNRIADETVSIAALLAVAGVSFAGSVQVGFEKIWGLPAGPRRRIWRQVVWLTAFIA